MLVRTNRKQQALINQWVSCVSDGWKSRWIESKHKSDYGQWKLTAGKFYGDAEADKGILSNSDILYLQIQSYHVKKRCVYDLQVRS